MRGCVGLPMGKRRVELEQKYPSRAYVGRIVRYDHPTMCPYWGIHFCTSPTTPPHHATPPRSSLCPPRRLVSWRATSVTPAFKPPSAVAWSGVPGAAMVEGGNQNHRNITQPLLVSLTSPQQHAHTQVKC